MSKHVIETVTFKLKEGISREEFAAAAQDINSFVTSQTGFIARRLSCSEDGEWIEHIEWSDMDAAKAAASKISSFDGNRPFLLAINGPTVTMRHSEVEVAIN